MVLVSKFAAVVSATLLAATSSLLVPKLRTTSRPFVRGARFSTQDPDAIMSDDPMIVKLEDMCAELNGGDWNEEVGLMQLLNPSKVVNLERELTELRASLESTESGDAVATDGTATVEVSREDLLEQIRLKEAKQLAEMRGVMRDWLKALFVWQSILSVVVCGLVAYDAVPFASPGLEIYVRVLGMWGMSSAEKSALDVAFLLTPLTNLSLPQATKDPTLIFWANLLVTGACYGWFFIGPGAKSGNTGGGLDASLPGPIKFALQAIDFGAGSERGLSMETREKLEQRQAEKAQQTNKSEDE